MEDYTKFVLERAKQGMKPSQVKKEEVKVTAAAKSGGNDKKDKKKGKSPSTLRHAVKKAEEAMSAIAADIVKTDDEMALAAAKDPKKFETLSRKRAQLQIDLEKAEVEWVAAEEALAEVS